MKAIVLTYDRNRPFAEHMMRCYERLWPDHPFVFRIPFQDESLRIESERIEAVATPPGIRATVLRLLEDLDDEEWVYWCIDDKYPIWLDLDAVRNIHRAIVRGDAEGIDGVLFCWLEAMRAPGLLTGFSKRWQGHVLLQRGIYERIWIHQYLRVKVIRHLFQSFSEITGFARIMDPMQRELELPEDHRLFVTETGLSIFGESTNYGEATRNCVESMRSMGIDLPESIPRGDYSWILGENTRIEKGDV